MFLVSLFYFILFLDSAANVSIVISKKILSNSFPFLNLDLTGLFLFIHFFILVYFPNHLSLFSCYRRDQQVNSDQKIIDTFFFFSFFPFFRTEACYIFRAQITEVFLCLITAYFYYLSFP